MPRELNVDPKSAYAIDVRGDYTFESRTAEDDGEKIAEEPFQIANLSLAIFPGIM